MNCSALACIALLGGVTEWLDRLSGQLNRAASGVADPVALVFVFLAGIVASLTPCVYPVIPLVVAYMSGSEASAVAGGAEITGRRRRAVMRSLAFVVGLAIVYTALGVAAILLGRPFGSLTQTWWGYAIVGIVFFVFGLSMWGLFELRVPSFILDRFGTGPRQGFWGAVGMGATSAIVAAPCAAPIVFSIAVKLGQEQRFVFGTAAMLVFSLGMGLLFLLLGIFSSLAASLPRPGVWMVTLKKVVAVVMIVMAGYFFYKGYQRW